MKNFFFKIAILLSILGFLSSTKSDSILKRYEIKSGILIYRYSGDASGIRVHYFDDYGMKESIKDSFSISFRSFKQEKNHLTLRNDYKLCKINLNNKEAVVKESAEFESFKNSNTTVHIYELNEKLLIKQGAEMLENAEIKGRECKVFKHHDTKKYIWKGIPLKIETAVMGMQVILELDEIYEDLSVSPNMFEIPSNVKLGNFKENSISL